MPALVQQYLTAEEMTHDWANLTGWSVAAVQVSSNRLYGVTGGNPAAAGKPFSVPAGAVAKVTAEIVEASTSPGMRFVGFSFGGANDGVNAALPDFIGLGLGTASKVVGVYIGANFTGVTTGQTNLATGLSAGTYRATVVVDETSISLVLQRQDGTVEWSQIVPRSAAPNGGAITSVICWNGATNGTSGSYIKAIGAKKSLTPFRTKSNAAGIIEGNTDFVMHRQLSDPWRIQLPANINGMAPTKVVVFFHQSATGNRNSVMTEARWTALRQALMTNGYALLSADDGGDRWGNPASEANYKDLLDWVKARVYCGKLYLLAYSMGGLPMWNSISHATMQPAAVTAICPVCDLIPMRANSAFTASIDAAWGSTSEATLIANSAGYNPMTSSKPLYAGVAYQFNLGAGDTTVPPEQHTDLFEPAIAPYAISTQVNTLGTGHGPAACFDPLVILPHFNAHP